MTSSKNRRNPYIIGRPINNSELFFGRDNLFEFIQDNLLQDVQVILLQGQRRIGKSSVLSHIPYFVRLRNFEFVYLDFQDKSRFSLSALLHNIATEIIEQLQIDSNIQPPSIEELEKDEKLLSSDFLPQIKSSRNTKIVLLLDEFDVLDRNNPNSTNLDFFSYLKEIILEHQQLVIIPVIGRQLEQIPNLLSLFKEAPYQKIGLLDRQQAKHLITIPAQESLEYDDDAIEAILALSAGHPYFTQVLCFAIFSQAREQQKWQVIVTDVNHIVEKAIETAQGGLVWFWEGLPILERVVLSAVAEVQSTIVNNELPRRCETWKLLQDYGIDTDLLQSAITRLVEWDFLDIAEVAEPGQQLTQYKVKIELVRRWLVKQHPLKQEISQLESFNSEANVEILT